MSRKFKVTVSPHIRSRSRTSRIMFDVCVALLPSLLAGIYFFGFRSLFITVICIASCVISEFLFEILAKRPVTTNDLSAMVTGMLLGLTLPVTVPWWICVIGSVCAIVLVKQLFGGIGDNFLNPALTARAVLLASWPSRLSGAAYVNPSPLFLKQVDMVTTATPLTVLNQSASGDVSIIDMLLGNIPGSIGEVCKVAIILGFVYLLARKVISWHIPVIVTASAAIFSFLFSWIITKNCDFTVLLTSVLSGGLLFGAVFMATDYTTTPMTVKGRVIFALGTGLLIAVIRYFGSYPEGVTYAILFMNIVTPLIDRYVKPRVYGAVKEARKNA